MSFLTRFLRSRLLCTGILAAFLSTPLCLAVTHNPYPEDWEVRIATPPTIINNAQVAPASQVPGGTVNINYRPGGTSFSGGVYQKRNKKVENAPWVTASASSLRFTPNDYWGSYTIPINTQHGIQIFAHYTTGGTVYATIEGKSASTSATASVGKNILVAGGGGPGRPDDPPNGGGGGSDDCLDPAAHESDESDDSPIFSPPEANTALGANYNWWDGHAVGLYVLYDLITEFGQQPGYPPFSVPNESDENAHVKIEDYTTYLVQTYKGSTAGCFEKTLSRDVQYTYFFGPSSSDPDAHSTISRKYVSKERGTFTSWWPFVSDPDYPPEYTKTYQKYTGVYGENAKWKWFNETTLSMPYTRTQFLSDFPKLAVTTPFAAMPSTHSAGYDGIPQVMPYLHFRRMELSTLTHAYPTSWPVSGYVGTPPLLRYSRIKFKYVWHPDTPMEDRHAVDDGVLYFIPEDDTRTADINESATQLAVIDSIATGWANGATASQSSEIVVDIATINQTAGKAGRIIIAPGSLIVDANRDGQINDNDMGQTSSQKPYRFWLNDDDDDLVDSSEPFLYEEWEEDDREISNSLNEDWRDNIIDVPRDLEDFTRLWFHIQKFSDDIKNGRLYVGLKWSNFAGASPAIKLYRSVDTQGSSDYLFSVATSSHQSLVAAIIDARYPDYSGGNFQSSHTLIEGSTTFIVPTIQFANLSESNPYVSFIFEACKAGKGRLDIVILRKEDNYYTKIGEGPGIWLEFKKPHEFIERWSCGNDSLGEVISVVRENSKSVSPAWGSPTTNAEKDYVLYVHGYNMQEFEKQRWIETTAKRLYWLGYKGRVGGFTWPCVQSAPPYDASEERAWQAAAQLKSLLNSLKATGYRVHVIGHSQGNVVVGEALRQWREAGNTMALVSTYIASQAAIQAHCYDSTAPLIPGFAGSLTDDGTPNVYVNYTPIGVPYLDTTVMNGASANWLNFQNPGDYALTGNSIDPLNLHLGWQLNQRLKPNEGFGYDSVLGFFDSRITPLSPLNIPQDRFTIFAYCAEGRSLALGSTNTDGVFGGNNIDLSIALGYGLEHRFHSAQFRASNAERYKYWQLVMQAINLTPLGP